MQDDFRADCLQEMNGRTAKEPNGKGACYAD